MKENKNENENETDKKSKKEENEEENNETLANLCSFNYTSSIKERVFSRNPNLVLKLFDKEDNKESIKEEKVIKNIEKISDNDEVNEIYNCLIFDNKEDISKNKEKEKEKEKEKDKENKSENEQGKSLQGSSIMNIFISPNITISQNDFLGNKTERDGK